VYDSARTVFGQEMLPILTSLTQGAVRADRGYLANRRNFQCSRSGKPIEPGWGTASGMRSNSRRMRPAGGCPKPTHRPIPRSGCARRSARWSATRQRSCRTSSAPRLASRLSKPARCVSVFITSRVDVATLPNHSANFGIFVKMNRVMGSRPNRCDPWAEQTLVVCTYGCLYFRGLKEAV